MKQSAHVAIVLLLSLALGVSGLVATTPSARAADAGTWTQLPLMGSTINSLVINPLTPSTLYAGTEYGVWRSVDSGSTWTAVNTGLTRIGAASLAVDPSTPSILYAGSDYRIFRSTDSGTTWKEVGYDFPNETAKQLVINPLTPSTLYAGTYKGVWRSMDSGEHWTAVNTGFTGWDVSSLVINPVTPTILYAGFWDGGVFRTTDGGDHWTAVNTGLTDMDVMSIAINPLTPSILYAGTINGSFRSTDSGMTWTGIGLTGYGAAILVINPLNPATLYAGIRYQGVFCSTDSGATWTEIATWTGANTGLSCMEIDSLAINPVAPSILYAGIYGRGVFRSADGGASWTVTGLISTDARRLAINPLTPSILYAGTSWAGIYRSMDSGDHWTAVNTGLTDSLTDIYVKCLAINPLTPSTVYAGTGGGVFRSTDSGTTWVAVNTGLTTIHVSCLAINPVTPTILYAGFSDGGVFRSTDSGSTWTAVNTGLTNTYISSLAINPLAPSTVYASTGGGVFRSTDSGTTWTAVNTGLTSTYIYSLAINPLSPSTVYAGTSGGVFRSTDSGTTWAAVNTGLPNTYITSLAINPLTPSTVYAGTGGGVFRSTDSGTTWVAVSTGLTNTYISSLPINPLVPSILYTVATSGVWRYGPSSGVHSATFTPLYVPQNGIVHVMEGSDLTQYYRVTDGLGSPLANATVTYADLDGSTQRTYVTDGDGLARLAFHTVGLAVGSYLLHPAVVVTKAGTTYTIASGPSVPLQMDPRSYTTNWTLGMEATGKVGAGAGAGAFVTGATSGGLTISYTKSDPDFTVSPHADSLGMNRTSAASGGAGVGLSAFDVPIPRVKVTIGDAEATLQVKTYNELNALFNAPRDASNSQKLKQAAFLLGGVLNASSGGAIVNKLAVSNPNALVLLNLLQTVIATGHVDKVVGGTGLEAESTLTAINASVGLSGGTVSGGALKFLNFEGKFEALHNITSYPLTQEVSSLDKLSFQASVDLFKVGLGSLTLGVNALGLSSIGHIMVEYIYGVPSMDFHRCIITFVGGSEEVSQEQKGIEFTITAGQIQSFITDLTQIADAARSLTGTGGMTISPSSGGDLLASILKKIADAGIPYTRVMFVDCAPTKIDAELGFNLGGNQIKLGMNPSFGRYNTYVMEEGFVTKARGFLPMVVYPDTPLVHQQTADLGSLLSQMFAPIGDAIQNSWNAVKQFLDGAVHTFVDVSAGIGGVVSGWLHLDVKPATTVNATPGLIAEASAGTQDIEQSVMAVASVPEQPPAATPTSGMSTNIQALAADNYAFVVGGLYDLQPDGATLSQPADLTLSYTDDAVRGRDESAFKLYWFDDAVGAWTVLPSTCDVTANTVAGSISRLGQYAIGYDVAPPTYSLIDVEQVGTSYVYKTDQPAVKIGIADSGSGVLPSSIVVSVDGTPYASAYDPATGVAAVSYGTSLAPGAHTLIVSATDTSGNPSSSTFQLNIETLPSAVTLTLGSVTPGAVPLSWSASTPGTYPLDHYALYRAIPGQGTDYTLLATLGTGTMTYTDADMQTPDEARSYIVEVVDSQGNVSTSAPVTATPITPPTSPTGLTAVPSGPSIMLAWSPSTAGTYPVGGYVLYRGTATGMEAVTPLATLGSAATSYIDTDLVAGVTYYYYIQAVDDQLSVHSSLASEEANAKADSCTLTTTSSPSSGGGITRVPDEPLYLPGTIVTLTATPATGYTFSAWSGATPVSGHPDQATITMDSDKTVTATFTAIDYGEPKSTHTWLDYAAGTSNVQSYDVDVCIDAFPATPDPAWLYYFAIQTNFSDGGGGAHGGLQWASGGQKANWGGYDLRYAGDTQSIVVDQPWATGTWYRYHVARGAQQLDGTWAWGFWITDLGTGTQHYLGEIYSKGSSISGCVVWMETGYGVVATTPRAQVRWRNPAYTYGALQATGHPVAGYATYNGTCIEPHTTDQQLISTSPREWIQLTNASVRTTPANTYIWKDEAFTLTTISSPSTGGTITRSPNQATYPHDTVVTLTASANPGYQFVSWTGATPVSGHPDQATITMDANKTVTANFVSDGDTGTDTGMHITSPMAGATITASAFTVNGTFDTAQSQGMKLLVTVAGCGTHTYNFTASGTTWSVTVNMADFTGIVAGTAYVTTLQGSQQTPVIPPVQSALRTVTWQPWQTVSYTLPLLPSWNIISVPFSTSASLLTTCDLVYAWDGSFWQTVTTLVPGTGYLVRNTAGATTVTLTGVPVSSPQTQPATGTWQIIGNPYATAASLTCTTSVQNLYSWDGSFWQQASATNLPAGLGFLFKTSAPGTITLTLIP